MKTILKLLLSAFIVSTFGAATCGEPDEKKEGEDDNNIVIINNSQTNNQTTNNVSINNDQNNKKDPVEYPFKNDPQKALKGLELMAYKCYANGEEVTSRMRFFDGGALTLDDFKGAETAGTWTISGDKISVSLPEIPFQETTTLIVIDLDVVATMVFPSTICGAIQINNQTPNEEEILYCASHEWVSEVLIENSEFKFTNNGHVFRRHWEELLSVPDTLYSTDEGIWKDIEGTVYVVFPRESGEDSSSVRYLTLTAENERVRVNEFTHPSGTKLCEWR